MAGLKKTFTIPSALVPELIEVFSEGYSTTITQTIDDVSTEVPNPQTKAQYASEQFDKEVRHYIKERVVRYREMKAVSDVNNDYQI